MADVELKVRGKAYGGWKSMRVQRGIEQLAGDFSLSVSELWPGQTAAERDGRVIVPGDECALALDGEPVVTGYVDELAVRHSAKRHQVDVAGRDRTADLVDCSAIRGAGQWRNAKLERIAQDLAAPFKVGVKVDADTGAPFPSFALQEGESVFEALSRMARIKTLLLTSDGAGRLVITRAGALVAPTALVLGDNILEASGSLSLRDRYSTYIKKGQASGAYIGFDGPNAPRVPRAAAQGKATAVDAEVTRYRPLVMVHDAPDVAASMQQQVAWERNVRAARGTSVAVTVQGWTHAGGLWKPNTRVKVVDPLLRVDAELLITTVIYQLDDGGTTCKLAMTRADAYSLLPAAPVRPGAGTNPFGWDPKPKGTP